MWPKIWDVVKARVRVSYIANKGIVSKLRYRDKVMFAISTDLENSIVEVKLYGNPNSVTHKYTNTGLYLLPLVLFLSQPLNTIDQRYINNACAPIVNPLKWLTKIDLYNEKWLCTPNSTTPTYLTCIHKIYSKINSLAFLLHHVSSYPSNNQLRKETHISPIAHISEESMLPYIVKHLFWSRPFPLIFNKSENHPAPVPPHNLISHAISKYINKHCFISNNPKGTMVRQWFLVRVHLDDSLLIDVSFHQLVSYYCVFLTKHPSNVKNINNSS